MNTLFDIPVNRYNTNSYKYDFTSENGKPADIIPMWVADMDFLSPPAVKEALLKAANHGLYGYTAEKGSYFQALHNWYLSRFHWDIQKEWLLKTPGVICAIATAIRILTKPGESVLIQPPVYYPFKECIVRNHRTLVESPLIHTENGYRIDFAHFEQQIKEHKVKLFILCSPHNPVGRVWTREELTKIGEICLQHHVKIISDEIHSDIVFDQRKHTVFSSISPAFADSTITCTAPSKTFNVAGLHTSNIFIPNENIRRLFQEELLAGRYEGVNLMGLAACEAAYTHGEDWLSQLLSYLEENRNYLKKWLEEQLPQIHMTPLEGTYLAWLDFRELSMTDSQLNNFLSYQAKVWLDRGVAFGAQGSGFMRMNLGCHRSTLQKALEQITSAVRNIK